jgi:beta-glucanase (GH16 family)
MLKIKITCLLVLCISTIALADWADEFDSWNSGNWNIQTGGGGWGNAELETYGTSNVTVSGGQLIITATRSGDTFTSGRINTQGKFSFQYGTIEAQITIPNLANGLWPGFWTLGTSGGWPNCGELDIMEMGGAAAISAGKVNQRVWAAAAWESGGGYAGYALTSDNGGGTMTNKMVWSSTMVTVYLNGGQIWAFDVSGGAGADLEEFVSWPYYIIINMAVGGYFPGITTPSGITAPFPAQYKVNYVRVTGTGGSTTTTASSTTTTASTTSTTSATTSTTASSTTTTAAGSGNQINCGGSAASPYVADYGYSGGSTASYTAAVNTSLCSTPVPPQAVFQTERYGNFTYTIGGFTAGSQHNVKLYFCENYWSAIGARKMNVIVNGVTKISNFDVYATTGAKNKASQQNFLVNANGSGQYVIQLVSVVDNALIDGIWIE